LAKLEPKNRVAYFFRTRRSSTFWVGCERIATSSV